MALTLPLAVFGPLATGADVRLLARPTGGELSPTALDAFSRFYYSGWRGSAEREAPYWAFFQLDDVYWGLIKSQVIAKRSMGVVFVSWMALLTEMQLDQIGWQTHRLWSGIFLDPLRLPEPGTLLDPVEIAPHETYRTREEKALADNLAYAIDTALEAGNRVYLPEAPSIGATPEAVLNAGWDRLGTLMAQCSYATWGGIEDQEFVPPRGPFDVVTGGTSRAGSGRVEAGTDRKPSAAWIDHRKRVGGIDPEQEAELTEEDVVDIAEARFRKLEARLVTQRDFSAFREIAMANRANSLAAPLILTRTIDRLQASDAAAAIDVFVAEALAHVQLHDSMSNPWADIPYQALSRGLAFRLAPATINTLSKDLFGDDSEQGLTAYLIDALDRQLRQEGLLEWAQPQTLAAMADKLPAGGDRDTLRERLVGLLAAHDQPRIERAERDLRAAARFTEADARYRRFGDGLSAHLRKRLAQRLAPAWGDRASAALAGKETHEQGLAAALAILVDMRERRGAAL